MTTQNYSVTLTLLLTAANASEALRAVLESQTVGILEQCSIYPRHECDVGLLVVPPAPPRPIDAAVEAVEGPAPVAEEPAPPAPVEEAPKIIPLDPNLPYIGTLRREGVTMAQLVAHAEAGTLTSIKGIGEAGAEKIVLHLATAGHIASGGTPAPAPAPDATGGNVFGGAPAPEPTPTLAPSGDVSLDEVKAALGHLAQNGGLAAVKAAIAAGGADTLAQVEPANYAAVIAKAEELAG